MTIVNVTLQYLKSLNSVQKNEFMLVLKMLSTNFVFKSYIQYMYKQDLAYQPLEP